MQLLLIVGLGGFIGAVARYLLGAWIQSGFFSFPAGTLAINVSGSFFIGLIMYASEYLGVFSQETRVFLTIGVLGAFTTLSTFSYETFRLIEGKQFMLAGANIFLTIFLSLLAVYCGRVAIAVLGGLK